MNKIQRILIGVALSTATLAAAPAAYADKYVVNNHYYGAYDRDHDDDYRRGHGHKKHKHCRHETVVHEHYYQEPVRERVIVVRDEPRYYEEPPRYYEEEPRYYGNDRADYGAPANGEYRSATPTIMGGIVGGLVGHQMGKGRGKDIATVAGVILGGSIGRDIGYRQ